MTPFHIHPQLYLCLNKRKNKDAPILVNGNIVRVMHAMLGALYNKQWKHTQTNSEITCLCT